MTRKKRTAAAAAAAATKEPPLCKGCQTPMQGKADYCVSCYRDRIRRCTNCARWGLAKHHLYPQALRLRQGEPCPVCNGDGYYLLTEGDNK